MASSIDFPCKDCTARSLFCHSRCLPYLACKAKHNQIVAEARAKKKQVQEFETYRVDRVLKTKRK